MLSVIESATAHLKKGLKPKGEIHLYTPSKEDEFVVLANAEPYFCVWGLNRDVALLFVNPKDNSHARMNPEVFSKWFIRTSKKKPDLRQWPHWAYNLRAYLHFNLVSMGVISPPPSGSDHQLSFTLHKHFLFPRLESEKYLLPAIAAGYTRPKAPRRGASTAQGLGPTLNQVEDMYRQMNYLSLPDTVKLLGREGHLPEGIVDQFLKKYLHENA